MVGLPGSRHFISTSEAWDRISNLMEATVRARDLRDLEQQIRDASFSTLCALVQLLDLKDLTTGVHSSRLAAWAVTVARLMGLSTEDTKQIEIAAALHDLG